MKKLVIRRLSVSFGAMVRSIAERGSWSESEEGSFCSHSHSGGMQRRRGILVWVHHRISLPIKVKLTARQLQEGFSYFIASITPR